MPPCAEASRGAARWAEGESAKVDVEMTVELSGTVNVAVVVGQEGPEARECCSEQRTPGGGMTLTPLRLHLYVSAEWTVAQIRGTAGQIPLGRSPVVVCVH